MAGYTSINRQEIPVLLEGNTSIARQEIQVTGRLLPGRNCIRIQPEGDPGHDDQHAARYIDSEEVVGELTLKRQVHSQAAVLSCRLNI